MADRIADLLVGLETVEKVIAHNLEASKSFRRMAEQFELVNDGCREAAARAEAHICDVSVDEYRFVADTLRSAIWRIEYEGSDDLA